MPQTLSDQALQHVAQHTTEIAQLADELADVIAQAGMGSRLRRDSLSSITYSEELISATISATLQSTDRHYGIVVQKRSHFQRDS